MSEKDIRTITITVTDLDFTNPVVEVVGEFNGSQSRRALAGAGKHIRVKATRAHYDRQYADEAKEQAAKDAKAAEKAQEAQEANDREEKRLADELKEEQATATHGDGETDLDEDLPEGDAETEEDSDSLSYLSDSDNGVSTEDK